MVAGSGVDTGNADQVVERYDIASNSWSDLPSMNERRDSSASCAIESCVYIFYGLDRYGGRKFSNTIEMLNMNNLEAGWKLIETGGNGRT